MNSLSDMCLNMSVYSMLNLLCARLIKSASNSNCDIVAFMLLFFLYLFPRSASALSADTLP